MPPRDLEQYWCNIFIKSRHLWNKGKDFCPAVMCRIFDQSSLFADTCLLGQRPFVRKSFVRKLATKVHPLHVGHNDGKIGAVNRNSNPYLRGWIAHYATAPYRSFVEPVSAPPRQRLKAIVSISVRRAGQVDAYLTRSTFSTYLLSVEFLYLYNTSRQNIWLDEPPNFCIKLRGLLKQLRKMLFLY